MRKAVGKTDEPLRQVKRYLIVKELDGEGSPFITPLSKPGFEDIFEDYLGGEEMMDVEEGTKFLMEVIEMTDEEYESLDDFKQT